MNPGKYGPQVAQRRVFERLMNDGRTGKQAYSMFGRDGNILQAYSSFIGIDKPSYRETFEESFSKLHHLHDNEEMYELFCNNYDLHGSWTGSGAHRFMPVATAVLNILNHDNLYGLSILERHPRATEALQYMTSEHPLFSTAGQALLPELELVVPEKDHYKWLDIGSAPKTGGAPTLNTLSLLLNLLGPEGVSYEIFGNDIFSPVFEESGNSLKLSGFVKSIDASGRVTFMDSTNVGGICYLSGRVPGYNVMDPENFMPMGEFDFISLCMTLHHLRDLKEPRAYRPFTDRYLLGSDGTEFKDAALLTCDSQVAAIDGILGHLSIGGICFLVAQTIDYELMRRLKTPDALSSNVGNAEMFFMIQRMDEMTFQIFDRYPILFEPDRRSEGTPLFMPSKSWDLKTVTKSEESLRELLKQADILAIRHQRWKNSRYLLAMNANNLLQNKSNLQNTLKDYLANIPDSGHPDSELKSQIIKKAREFDIPAIFR